MDALMKALQAAMAPKPPTPPANTETAANATCESNPNLAGCPVKAPESDSWNKKQPESEFKEVAKADAAGGENFNTGGGEGTQPAGYTGNGGEQKFGTPATNTVVANGGGQMPGGGSGAPAAGGGAAGGALAQKVATDIMHGMQGGGGYSAMNAGMQMQNGAAGGGFSGYGAQGGDGYKAGMVDLRQFLPGGKNDPTRKLAGGAATFQIQPQTVNIWSRISERFRARCTQGLLRDCSN